MGFGFGSIQKGSEKSNIIGIELVHCSWLFVDCSMFLVPDSSNLTPDSSPNNMENNNWEKLEQIERLARGSVWNRFLNNPAQYVSAVGYWRLIYPILRKGKFAQASTFFGADMQVALPSATEIYLFGAKTHDSEIRLARFLMKSLLPGDTFCDVGAHFGYFTLLASHLVGAEGKVVSFEASQSTFAILKKNTAGLDNITIEHKAASDQAGTVTFHEFPALFSEYNSMVLPSTKQSKWLRNNPPQLIEVHAQRLDHYFDKNSLIPKIIKIDVEGAEPQVLGGLVGFIETHSPTIVMEYLTDSSQQNAHRDAVQFAKEQGYHIFVISNSGELKECPDIELSMAKRRLTSDNLVMKRA